MKNIRTCVACRQKFDKTKADLVKVTLKNNELVINNGEHFGRSVYICNNEKCIHNVIKNKTLNKVLRRQVSDEIYDNLNSIKR